MKSQKSFAATPPPLTVGDLIAHLSSFDPCLKVAVECDSDYTWATKVEMLTLFNNGGYLAHPHRNSEKAKTGVWVHIR
jgi:hypothetical protein